MKHEEEKRVFAASCEEVAAFDFGTSAGRRSVARVQGQPDATGMHVTGNRQHSWSAHTRGQMPQFKCRRSAHTE
eukprot:2889567-Rhodomonas_salina.2